METFHFKKVRSSNWCLLATKNRALLHADSSFATCYTQSSYPRDDLVYHREEQNPRMIRNLPRPLRQSRLAIWNINDTVCLGWTNNFFIFSFFMSQLVCYWKVWLTALYRKKDERLTPNIHGVMVIRIWCLLAQNKPDNAESRPEIDPKLTTKWLVWHLIQRRDSNEGHL